MAYRTTSATAPTPVIAPRQGYFDQLNYTLGNEDASIELELCPERAKHVLSVAGCGARVLPLAAKSPTRLTCVDVSRAQLALTQLRVAAARIFTHTEFLAFWGYPPYEAAPKERQALFVRLPLPSNTRQGWVNHFAARQWESPLLTGRWERTFCRMNRVVRALMGKAARELCETRTIEEQRDFMRTHFPHRAWDLCLLLLGNSVVFNALLYGGHFPRKSFRGSFLSFYRHRFGRLLELCPARESFFLQLIFLGKLVYPEGNPIECGSGLYHRIQQALQRTTVHFREGDVVHAVRDAAPPPDFVSMSDVPSYLSGAAERSFLAEMRDGLAPSGTVVFRTYLHAPDRLDTTGFDEMTPQHADFLSREKVGVYDIRVFRKSPY
jgi:S-adenosylmethionine-diacylglycerol 3-amino-3-carboxypropyl transferase